MPGKALEGSITSWKLRPSCQIDGCSNPAMYQYQYDDGDWKWRVRHGKIICSAHHTKGWHPTLKHRKDHCENRTGFLGFKCTTNIFWEGMLDVDHKNGNPSDNRPANLQTLCKCCHAYKTHSNKDYLTDGRKALGFTSGYK
jgi:hypothetical protein